ncbi:hypothetical protein [Streptomyces sp. NPDC059072]|uniref:hypothetical protein n=1 Tax=unclassified Streptomyces TaxID=2593676 RepID=UPI00369EBD67
MTRKKYVVPAVVLVTAAVVLAAVQLWPSPLKDLRARNRCLGMLTEKTVGSLDDAKGGKLVVDEDRSEGSGPDPVFSTICFVGRETDKGTTPRIQFTLDVRPAESPNPPVNGATLLTGRRSGWVGPRQSEVQLPAGCPKKMKAGAAYVTVTLKVSPGILVAQNWNEADVITAARTVVLEAVDNLAEQYGCKA